MHRSTDHIGSPAPPHVPTRTFIHLDPTQVVPKPELKLPEYKPYHRLIVIQPTIFPQPKPKACV